MSTRRYRQTRRAEQTAATSRRIVEAAIRLHATVGPARTSLSAVAEEAGVSRPTLYSHFPDEASLIRACTTHWMSQDPLPDPTSWLQIPDPGERLNIALGEVYSHYERNEELIDNVFRDMQVVDAMRSFNKPLVEEGYAVMAETLAAAFDDEPSLAARRTAMVSVAIGFNTWKHLVRERRLTGEEAVSMMAHAVRCVGGESGLQR